MRAILLSSISLRQTMGRFRTERVPLEVTSDLQYAFLPYRYGKRSFLRTVFSTDYIHWFVTQFGLQVQTERLRIQLIRG